MRKSYYKQLNDKNVFTDFKHHAKSWANSKRMRSRRIRQQLKTELRPTQMSVTKYEVTS